MGEQQLAEKMARLTKALRLNGLEANFQVLDTEGWTVAECNDTSVRIFKNGRASDWQFDAIRTGNEPESGEKKK